jgi:glycosyltransferase involved in cell wall biosynthesis
MDTDTCSDAETTYASPANRFAVSVVIPTKNRKDQLRDAIGAVLEQTVKCEIIVIDDGSTDDTGQMVRTEFPAVRCERHAQSRGPTASRNRGAEIASGDILVTLDDDCVFSREDAIEICLQWFDLPEIAGVTLPFVNVRQDDVLRTAAPSSDQAYATLDYYAGMVAFRRSAFLALGGYRTEYFMHYEESDLAIRLLNQGRLIRNGNVALIRHLESLSRDRAKLWRLGARNAILYALFNIPLALLPFYLAATVTKTFLYAVKHGGSLPVIKGFLEAIPVGARVWRHRKPVTWKAYGIARKLKHDGPAPINKVMDMLTHG